VQNDVTLIHSENPSEKKRCEFCFKTTLIWPPRLFCAGAPQPPRWSVLAVVVEYEAAKIKLPYLFKMTIQPGIVSTVVGIFTYYKNNMGRILNNITSHPPTATSSD
jgi:hypothetical protein